ncbi:class III poly(R)-hydroxyalkanoic acid synthase subunit PhaC [soil metagenome]
MHNFIAEIMQVQQKLAKGAELLRNLDDVEIGTTTKAVLYQQDGVRLYRYKSNNNQSTPLLIVFALVNRPSILDLNVDCSLIQDLLQVGQDVYLVDWGYPTASNNTLTLSDYINLYLKNCVNFITQNTQHTQINLLGVCQGGVMALCYSCLYPQDVNAIITAVTPIDFHTQDNILGQIIQEVDIDALIKHTGNIPGSWLQQTFISLNPFRLMGKKYLDLIDILDDAAALKRFLCIEKWLHDTPNLAAAAFAEFLKEFYQQNKLIKGEIYLAKRKIDLRCITQPLLNIIATNDQIIPPSASSTLQHYISSQKYTCKMYASGHIGIFVSHKIRAQLSTDIVLWLNKEAVRL